MDWIEGAAKYSDHLLPNMAVTQDNEFQ
jgi:hypothetical protein